MAKVVLRVVPPSGEDPKPPKKPGKVLLKVSPKPLDLLTIDKELTENLSKNKDEVVDFFNTYLDSTEYKKRLLKQGYSDPDEAIASRKAALRSVGVEKQWGGGNYYDTEKKKVLLDPNQFRTHPAFTVPGVFGHEFAHVAGATNPLNENIQYPNRASEREYNEFESRNKLFKLKKIPEDLVESVMHDRSGHESKADLDALRYLLYRDKIYNTGTQEFNKDFLNEAKKRYANDFSAARLFKNFSDEDIVYLMNNIAKAEMPKKIRIKVGSSNPEIS